MGKLFSFLLLFLPALLFAEPADSVSAQSIELEEIVVTSFKQDKIYRLSPVSASVVNAASIEKNNITGMKDFSAFIPNLFIPDYGSKLTSPVYIRGIGSKTNAPSVGLYVDDMPFFEKSAFDFDFSDIDRVEVLRGPQGTLYGRNTMGGIINVYTKSPRKHRGTHINLSQGNYTNLKSSLSHYGSLNKKIGYGISGNYTHSNGHFTNIYNGQKVDELESASARLRLEWELNRRLRLNVISNIDYLDQGGYPYSEYDPDPETFADVNYNRHSLYRRTISTSGINLEYKGNGFVLNGQSSFQYLSDKQGIDQDFSPQDIYYVVQEQQQRMWSQEWNIKSQNESNYKWLFGAFGFYQGIDNRVVIDNFAGGINTLKVYDMPTYGVAFYHQSTYNNLFVEGLSAGVGLRYDYEKAKIGYNEEIEAPGAETKTAGFESELNFSQLTPKFTLQYTFPSKQTVYAAVSKGYKTGGFNLSFEKDEDRSFDPEQSWNYEIGSKQQFFHRRLEAEVSLFYIDWKNQQIAQPLPTRQGSMLKNAGRSESKGVEVSLTGRPVRGLVVHANYGYTHAKFRKYQRSETLDYSGKYIPFVPSFTYMIGADYTLFRPGGGLDKITIGADYTGTGKLYWNDSNNLYQNPYSLLNGKVSLTRKNVTFGIWARNLTNREYAAFVFESGKKYFAQRGKPFTFGGNIVINI